MDIFYTGLLGCPFHSRFILNDNLRTTVCLSDVKIDIYKLNEIHDFLIGPFSYAFTQVFIL